MSELKLVAMDVDGTLTDGKIYMGPGGEMMKAFSIKDGAGIVYLGKRGVIPAIITGRQSKIVEERAKELHITECHQGITDKLKCLTEIASGHRIGLEQIAYIGDDLSDLVCINAVRNGGGITGCPADAAQEVRDAVSYVCVSRSGDGAVREFIDWLIKSR